ncbi:MAG: S26 family signal peptidase [Anaerovoracaceae bacterium]
MHSIRKILALGFSALLGAVLGVVLSACLMMTEVAGSDMLPSLEPGEKVLVLRSAFVDAYEPGDLVVYQTPYYTADGGDDQLIRRVTGIRGSWIRLNCDAKTTRDRAVLTEPGQLLGKVIFSFGGL